MKYSRAVLLGAFAAGVLIIVSLRYGVEGITGTLWAAAAALLIMVLVSVYYSQVAGNAEERQIAGDNLYYLGLLFTLTSLILALWLLFVVPPKVSVDERAYDLIGNFGIALVSTVAGILARILFQSLPDGPVTGDAGTSDPDQGESAGQSIGDQSAGDTRDGSKADGATAAGQQNLSVAVDARELREELTRLRLTLREANDGFLHFNRITSEQAQDVLLHTGSMMRQQSEELGRLCGQQLEQVSSSLQAVCTSFETNMTALTTRFTAAIDEFTNTLSHQANQGIAVTSEAWSDAAVKLKTEGERQIESMYQDVNALLQGTDQLWSQIRQLLARMEASMADLHDNAGSLQAMVRHSADAGTEMKNFLEGMNQVRSELAAATRATSDSTRELANVQQKLALDLDETSARAVQAHGKATEQITRQVTEQVESGWGQLQLAILQLVENLEQQQKSAVAQIERAQKLDQQSRSAQRAGRWQSLFARLPWRRSDH